MSQSETKPAGHGPIASVAPDPERPRVLLVDDQPARLLTYESILEGVGVACVRARSGREALERLLRQSFAVILLDVSMPDMDGFETARLIREHPKFERTPIIFVTGMHVSELDTLKGYEVGAIDYLPVPIVPELLRSKVALLVELYRRRTELESLNRDLEATRLQLEAERSKNLSASPQELRAREARYRALFEHPTEHVLVLEAMRAESGTVVDLRYQDANANALRYFNRPREALLGKRLTEVLPDRAGSLIALCNRVLAEREPHHYEVHTVKADFRICLFPMGENTIISSGVEVTARTRAESEVRRLLGDLHLREQELRDADRRKDEFIAMLAHELRNPLVPIRTGVELLKSARERPELVDTVRPMMERQVGHMVRLIDDLLDVSRISSGRIELRRQPVTLSSLVGTAIEANSVAISAGGLELTVSLAEPHWVLNVDPIRFSQVISNLLQNAVKFTPAGGRIGICAKLEPAEDARTLELLLRVTDTGIGISESMLPRVFELFCQGNADDQGKHAGLGVGLAIARRLTELHGGTLTAQSEGIGRGSEFTLRVPAPRDLQTPDGAAPRGERALHGVRVLVVDDNRDAADVMAILVQDLGAVARVAYDGPSGLAAVREFHPAVVLLDIGMPGMDGYEACREIRGLSGPGIGIVALTGWGQEQDKQLAAEAGFDAHLTKPADPSKLEAVIRELGTRTRGSET